MLFSEPFDLPFIIEEATNLYKSEAVRRGLEFRIDCENSPRMVIGDSSKIRTVVANLTANARTFLAHCTSFLSLGSEGLFCSCVI